jgi:hypothetical protein
MPVVSGVICLGLGIAAGIVLANVFREPEKRSTSEDPAVLAAAASGGPKGGGGMPGGPPGGNGGMPGGGMPGGPPGGKGGMPGGPPGGGFGGGFGGPTAKMQLTLLIAKLDQLIGKPIVIELTPEQKKQAASLLADLETRDALTEEEAKEKLNALLKLLESQKDMLTAAGYRWPGTPPGGGGGGPPGGMLPPNPFKMGESADRLKSLQSTLGK